MLLTFLLVNVLGMNALAGQPGKAQWTASIGMPPMPRSDAQVAGMEIASTLSFRGVQAGVREGRLEMSGNQDVEQLRGALFDDAAAESLDFLGGPVEVTLEVPAGDRPITLQLESRLTTGYLWEVVADPDARYIQQEESASEMRNPAIGAPAVQTIQLYPNPTGGQPVRLIYRRSFEQDAPIHARVTITLSEIGDLIELTDPTPIAPVLPERKPDADTPLPSGGSLLPRALPTSYDARGQGIVPAVRDQGSCGSCWAFGTVGVMEIAIKKGGGDLTNLSEQYLISCNRDNWGCNGGLTASKYHYNTLGANQSVAGAVLESDKPYGGTNGTCSVAYSHPYKASSWQFLTGSEWTMPSNDQIKNAIMTYGAVTAGVCVDNGWYGYRSGVYSSSSNICNGYTNHQIVLVGWNDADQAWILRNSWGTGWGESGYMRIKYDPNGATSRVGEGSSWIAFNGGASPTASLAISKVGSGTVTSSPAGIDCGSTCSASFTSGASVTLTATPATGYAIGNWGGACSGTGTTCTLAMNGGKSVTVQFVQDATVPTAPTNLAARAVSPNQINLAWTDTSGNETGFKIERKTGANGTWSQIATTGANVIGGSNLGLTPGTLYVYRVRAYNATGNSDYTSEVSATTPSLLPTAPANLTGEAQSPVQVRIAWQDNSSNETGFKIERRTGTGGWSQIATVGANATSYTNTRLTHNTSYSYRVRAYNRYGNSAYGNEINVTTPSGLPKTSGNLTANALSATQVRLAWQDNSTNETGFRIERKIGTGAWSQIATVGANVTGYTNSSLKTKTMYVYRVRAYNGYGNSDYTNEVSVTTP